ncbi:hypothetical protein FOL47_006442 [Perkinsus chesapeaki]|uniref:Uncharacterized protein n=1 Tax=Perkinsus chesapeaki TaxID=330153 RepID=A0A7J6MXX1_PERCH|nr:hypothetical protein FOL47_006442 [Perkinsus chesapeaki]
MSSLACGDMTMCNNCQRVQAGPDVERISPEIDGSASSVGAPELIDQRAVANTSEDTTQPVSLHSDLEPVTFTKYDSPEAGPDEDPEEPMSLEAAIEAVQSHNGSGRVSIEEPLPMRPKVEPRSRRLAARRSNLEQMAVVLVDKYNTAYRIVLLLLLILLAFVCGIQCYAQFIVPVPPTASELDTLAPETLTNPQNTRYETTAAGVVETIILGSIGLVSLVRAVMLVKTMFMSAEDKLKSERYHIQKVQICKDRSECTIRKRIKCMYTTLRNNLSMTGDWFWYGYFAIQISDTIVQIIRLLEQGGRTLTGDQGPVADRLAIMTQATIILLVLLIGPITLILNNRVWATLFDVIAAFSFTTAYLIVSGKIIQPDTWHTLHFKTFIAFFSSLLPAVMSLEHILSIDDYLIDVAKHPELTRGQRRGRLRCFMIAFTLWFIGISGYSYVSITQFKGDCPDVISRFKEECLLPVYPILDSDSCDCRMASVYLQGDCVQDDMTRLQLYNRIEYLMISDNNPTPSASCTNESQALVETVSQLSELVVLSLVAVPLTNLTFSPLQRLEVLLTPATQLAHVPDDVHQRFPAIRSFQFELSRIQTLPFDSLQQLTHLEYLGLAGNTICQTATFPAWTTGIVDCGSNENACAVDASLVGLSQSLTGYCRKWTLGGGSQLCLPACTNFFAPTFASTDMDSSGTMSAQENTALFQMFGLIPAGTNVSVALQQCVMEACGKTAADELTASVEAVLFLLGESSCEACP